jgi:hypothetical protein
MRATMTAAVALLSGSIVIIAPRSEGGGHVRLVLSPLRRAMEMETGAVIPAGAAVQAEAPVVIPAGAAVQGEVAAVIAAE